MEIIKIESAIDEIGTTLKIRPAFFRITNSIHGGILLSYLYNLVREFWNIDATASVIQTNMQIRSVLRFTESELRTAKKHICEFADVRQVHHGYANKYTLDINAIVNSIIKSRTEKSNG